MNKISTIAFIIVCVFSVFFYSPTLQAAEHPWRLRVNKGGIQAYTRPVDGSAILEFKASVIVDAPLSQVIALFEDVKKMTSWFYQCTASRIIQEGADGQSKIVYIILHLPWPVTERDCIFQISKSVDSTAAVLNYTIVALADRLPADRARIRIPYLKASWRFSSLADGKTEIYFQQHSDPGGFIPTFISNSIVVDMPYNSLKNLRALIKEIKK